MPDLPPPPPGSVQSDPLDGLPSFLPVEHDNWREAMLRPGMAAAMLYVLYQPVFRLIEGHYQSLEQAQRDFSAWFQLAFPESEALIAMFNWVEQQIVLPAEQSALPPDLRGLLLAAWQNYDIALEGDD